jgi:hypothetical protein
MRRVYLMDLAVKGTLIAGPYNYWRSARARNLIPVAGLAKVELHARSTLIPPARKKAAARGTSIIGSIVLFY